MIPVWKKQLGIAGGGAVVVYATITHTSTSATWTATLVGLAGKYVTFDWGDGSAPTTLELATGGVDFAHDYSGSSGTKIIRIYGDFDAITRIYTQNNNVNGISNWSGLTNLELLYCYNHEISDISTLAGLTNLTHIRLYNNSPGPVSISDISVLAGLTNLTILYIYGNDISDVSPLAGLTNLTTLDLYNCDISDISDLMGLLNLTYLNLGSNDLEYTGYTWFTATSGTFWFYSTVDSSDEVDQWLIDLNTANWSNCTVYLDGTNPARTSASDAAVAALVLAGVILHLN